VATAPGVVAVSGSVVPDLGGSGTALQSVPIRTRHGPRPSRCAGRLSAAIRFLTARSLIPRCRAAWGTESHSVPPGSVIGTTLRVMPVPNGTAPVRTVGGQHNTTEPAFDLHAGGDSTNFYRKDPQRRPLDASS
jgi:hypothetical protein